MANEFLGPYAASKFLEGVIEALPKIRGTLLQTTMQSGFVTRNTKSVNFDEEFAVKNTHAIFVHPKADVTPVQLGDFSTKELYFAYTKEGWDDNDDFDTELDVRQIGQQFGQTNPLAVQAARLMQKAAIAEVRIQNLFELTQAQLAMYGGYEAYSEKHPRVRYDFGRNVTTTYADLAKTGGLVSSVNLTTSAVTAPWDSSVTILPVVATSGGFTAGDRAWTRANVTAAKATPVDDLTKMYETSSRWGAVPAYYIMQDDAYDAFNFDVTTNHSKEADRTIRTMVENALDLTVKPQEIDGLTYKRTWIMGNGFSVPIYSYNAKINNRATGVEESFIGSGWVIGIPAPSNGLKVYGRIKHPRANYAAMPRFINRWTTEKDMLTEYEVHSNFIIGHKRINALTAWKVV
jgi:hypothetical protein